MTTPASISERSPAARPFTLSELMVAAAAREIQDGEVVFVGMRLPLIAFVVAKRTHAPQAVGLFENGVIRSTPAQQLIYTMADPPNILGATQCLDMLGVMSLLQSGRVDLGFLGAAEVDRFGNLNSTRVLVSGHDFSRADTVAGKAGASAPGAGLVRLPGSGGACDIASLAKRFVVLMEHAQRRLPERVSYVTSPGNGSGAGWRKQVGLPRGGPSAAITTKAVLRFGEDGEAYLASVHPGVTVEEVVANTGWKLRVPAGIGETESPSAAELAAIRDYDKQGFNVLMDPMDFMLDYQLGGIVATKDQVAADPDLVRRVVKSYVEGVHFFKRHPDFVVSLLKKYSQIEDREVALKCYQQYAEFFLAKPYPTAKGIQTVLNHLSRQMPEAGKVSAERFIDRRWLKELDDGGFIDEIYRREPAKV